VTAKFLERAMANSSAGGGRFEHWAITGWAITGWAAAVVVWLVVLIVAVLGWTEHALHGVVRTTAQTSFLLFFLAFTASSLYRLRPSRATRWALRNRRYLGVGFAASHFLHLGALVALGLAFPEPFRSELNAVTLVGGGLAYGFILAMALTSSDRAQARLGRRRWRQLHLIGSWYIWILFAQSYLPRVWEDLAYLPFGVAVIAAGALRAAPYLRFTAANPSRLPTKES
jgi:hypothetical protein